MVTVTIQIIVLFHTQHAVDVQYRYTSCKRTLSLFDIKEQALPGPRDRSWDDIYD